MTDKWLWLNYHHLLYFLTVVEEGGLVPAGERLHVSHSTVSEQLKKLETHLQVKLFERRGRKLQLTEDGTFVHGYARQLFGVGAALVEAVEARRSGRVVLCRVGIDSVIAKLLVRSLLAPMLDAVGDALHIRCIEDEREPLIAQLVSRRLDVVLSDARPHMVSSAVQGRVLARSPISFFAAPQLARELEGEFPASLQGAPMLVPLAMTRLRLELERWFGERGLRPRIVGEIEDSGLLKAFGQEGRGVFAMPAAVREDVEKQYGVVHLGTVDSVRARVFALTTETSDSNAAVRALLAAHTGNLED
ncbi:MAG: LysR family transcriptional regulator [Planctomycetota bacterium]